MNFLYKSDAPFDVIEALPCKGGYAVFAELLGKTLMSYVVFWTKSLDSFSDRTAGELFFEKEWHLAVDCYTDMVLS